VTPAELEQITAQLRAVLMPYVARLTDARRRPADSRFVRLFLAATPMYGVEPEITPTTLRRTSNEHPETVVQTADGSLRAGIWGAGADSPLPGIVLVDGSATVPTTSGRSCRSGWPGVAQSYSATTNRLRRVTGQLDGADVRRPRRESLAAVRVLRQHPATAGQPVGLYGVSQGGWVSLLAATLAGPESRVDL